MLNRPKFAIRKALGLEFSMLECMLFEFENFPEMCKWFDWGEEPKLRGEPLYDYVAAPLGIDALIGGPYADALGDPAVAQALNLLLLRDAEVVCGVEANRGAARSCEIGMGSQEKVQFAESLYNETRAVLSEAETGDYILWHQFDLALAGSDQRIYEVCVGLEELYCSQLLRGEIFHVRDSRIGLYRVPSNA
jgi:hypothetical protein